MAHSSSTPQQGPYLRLFFITPSIVLRANMHCFPGQTSRHAVCVAQLVTCTLAFTLNHRVLSSRELIPSLHPGPKEGMVILAILSGGI